MRIIAGSLGGRQFNSPQGRRTHPMSDKARGALFNALGDIDGLTVLDAFAGSGALSFEAISRGAASAVAIDLDKKAQMTIKENINSLGLQDRVKLISANVASWSERNSDQQFGLVVAAPPYDDLQLPLVQKLTGHTKTGGLFVLDWPGKAPAPNFGTLEIVNQKNYGDAQLIFYRPKGY